MRELLLTCCSILALGVVACAAASGARHAGGGRELYQSRCASCHRLYDAREHTRGEWAGLLERMAPRAHLSAGERDAVGRYLEANAREAEASPSRR